MTRSIRVPLVTTPQQMESDLSKIEEAIKKFEEKWKTQEKGNDYYYLVISGEYNRLICNKIERIYSDAGWSSVICKTSSENGERPGLTSLQLYR